jgi:hypothetical protein
MEGKTKTLVKIMTRHTFVARRHGRLPNSKIRLARLETGPHPLKFGSGNSSTSLKGFGKRKGAH